MVRPLLLSALTLSLALSVPRPAAANDRPLKILCSSITMDYCVNVWEYEWWISKVFDDGFTHANRIVVEPFGSGFESNDGLFILNWMSEHRFVDGSSSVLLGGSKPLENHPGRYVLEDLTGHGSPTVETRTLLIPSVNDLTNLFFTSYDIRCDPGVSCYEVPFEVPEPLSGLLLGTGLLGVAVARRRRAD